MMKRLLFDIDFHIIVMGFIVSALFVGIVSMITFAPGTPGFVPVLCYCSIPTLVFLEPTIITGAIDRRKHRADSIRYFVVNTFIALTYGIISGLLVYSFLPDNNVPRTTRAEQDVAPNSYGAFPVSVYDNYNN